MRLEFCCHSSVVYLTYYFFFHRGEEKTGSRIWWETAWSKWNGKHKSGLLAFLTGWNTDALKRTGLPNFTFFIDPVRAGRCCIFLVFDCLCLSRLLSISIYIHRYRQIFLHAGFFLSAWFGCCLPCVEQRRVAEVWLKLLEVVGRACRESAAFLCFSLPLSFFMLVLTHLVFL